MLRYPLHLSNKDRHLKDFKSNIQTKILQVS